MAVDFLAAEITMLMLPGIILPTTTQQELYILSNNYRMLYECVVKLRLKEGLLFV